MVEVSDTSLNYDRKATFPLYAAANIEEVLIVNLINNITEVHQDPSKGLYRRVKICNLREMPSLQSFTSYQL